MSNLGDLVALDEDVARVRPAAPVDHLSVYISNWHPTLRRVTVPSFCRFAGARHAFWLEGHNNYAWPSTIADSTHSWQLRVLDRDARRFDHVTLT